MKKLLNKNHWLLSNPIAHRGLADVSLVENTLPAFKKCIELNIPIETDLRYTKDRKIICFHDENFYRLAGINTKVCNLFGNEIKKIAIKGNNRVVFFKDLLKFVSGKVPLLIEIKHNTPKGIEKDVLTLLKGYKGDYAIQSFNPKSVIKIRKLNKNILVGQLINLSKKHQKLDLIKWRALNKFIKPNFVSCNIETLKNNSFSTPTIAWTIQNNEQLKKAKTFHKNIIFEDVSLLNPRLYSD